MITYSINGSITLHGVEADWRRIPIRDNVDGAKDFTPWATHLMTIPQMEMSTFLSLQALQGEAVSSLETNDIDARNTARVYPEAFLSVVNCGHIGRRATNIRLEWKVKVS